MAAQRLTSCRSLKWRTGERGDDIAASLGGLDDGADGLADRERTVFACSGDDGTGASVMGAPLPKLPGIMDRKRDLGVASEASASRSSTRDQWASTVLHPPSLWRRTSAWLSRGLRSRKAAAAAVLTLVPLPFSSTASRCRVPAVGSPRARAAACMGEEAGKTGWRASFFKGRPAEMSNNGGLQGRRRLAAFARGSCVAASIASASLMVVLLLLALLNVSISTTFHFLGLELPSPDAKRTPEFLIPWLDCDCAGEYFFPTLDASSMRILSRFSASAPQNHDIAGLGRGIVLTSLDKLEWRLETLQDVIDPSCNLCTFARFDTTDKVTHFLDESDKCGGRAYVKHLLRRGYALVASVVANLYPNVSNMVRWAYFAYDSYFIGDRLKELRQQQNRGIAGGAVVSVPSTGAATALPPAALLGVPEGPWSTYPADTIAKVVPHSWDYVVVEGSEEARDACAARRPLQQSFLARHALPWGTIKAAAHRTTAEWMADRQSRPSTLRSPVHPSSSSEPRRLQAAAGHADREGREVPEIIVASTGRLEGFQSYLCKDLLNASKLERFWLDPERVAALVRPHTTMAPPSPPLSAHVGKSARREGNGAGRVGSAGPTQPLPTSSCIGCTFQCVHPRIARQHFLRSRHVAAAVSTMARRGGDSNEEVDAPLLSWDVSLEDIDAGVERVFVDDGSAVGGTVVRPLTREDLFKCKLLQPSRGSFSAAAPSVQIPNGHNEALLLSADVWLTHFSEGLPFFFANRSTIVGHRNGTVGSHSTETLTRLLPLHTAAVYGESLQGFSEFALRPSYWLQFDTVYLQNRLRRRDALFHMWGTGGTAASDGPGGKTGHSLPPPTTFGMWTVTQYYLRDFQLIVQLNQLRRQLLRSERDGGAARLLTLQSASMTLSRMTRMQMNGDDAASSGALHRLTLELLHGADPLLLPMHGENLQMLPLPVAWSPPSTVEWAREGAETRIHSLLNFSSGTGRIRAIAVSISNCWHDRVWWLSELSRYYPVHNYGRCLIPTPTPLPGDATPVPGIPQRLQLSIPPECAASLILAHHDNALRTMPTSAGSRVGQQRSPQHVLRDYELRCVFRKYRYVMPFENTIEDDHVTEKVYNALLSGALPLYIGAMNIADYLPRTAKRSHRQSGGSSGNVPVPHQRYSIPVVPVLQMFPLLNESAWRTEARRLRSVIEKNEAVSNYVLHTHATVLRTGAALKRLTSGSGTMGQRIREATATAETVAAALDTLAEQGSGNLEDHHYLLLKGRLRTTDVGACESSDRPSEQAAAISSTLRIPDTVTTTNNITSGVPAALWFRSSTGAWPQESPSKQWTPEDDGRRAGADHREAADPSVGLVGYGLSDFLHRVHRGLHNPGRAASPQHRLYTRLQLAQERNAHTIYRRVRDRFDLNWSLTANTASAFQEQMGNAQSRSVTRVSSTALNRERAAAQRFGVADDRNLTPIWCTPGDALSTFFVRRSVPGRGDTVMAAAAQRPKNGFAQLAAYLRALDDDPSLVEDAGYFDWWRAETLEDFGPSFLEKLFMPHPICSICAAALEKKEAAHDT